MVGYQVVPLATRAERRVHEGRSDEMASAVFLTRGGATMGGKRTDATARHYRVTVALREVWIAEVVVAAMTEAEARDRVEGLDPRSLRYTLLDEFAEVGAVVELERDRGA